MTEEKLKIVLRDWFRQRVTDTGLTKTAFGEQIGRTKVDVVRMYAGTRIVNWGMLCAISERIGPSLSAILAQLTARAASMEHQQIFASTPKPYEEIRGPAGGRAAVKAEDAAEVKRLTGGARKPKRTRKQRGDEPPAPKPVLDGGRSSKRN